MDAKTPGVDRVLDALSLALTAELNRVVQETRESLEQEFQFRLQTAVKDAETTAASANQAQLERAVEQAKEEARGQALADMERQFNSRMEASVTQLNKESAEDRAKLGAKVNQLEAEAKQLKDEWTAERTKLQEGITQWRAFAELPDELSKATSQSEILMKFLRLTQPFAAGMAIYVTKRDGLALWNSRGRATFPDIISQDTTDPESYFRTLSVRGKTVGAICARPPFKMEAMDFLVASLERAIELFGIKLQGTAQKAASERS